MERKSFIRNAILGLCMAFLPKVLLPSTGEVEEEIIEIPVKVQISWAGYTEYGNYNTIRKESEFTFLVKAKKKDEAQVREYLENLCKANKEQAVQASVASKADSSNSDDNQNKTT